MKKLSIFLFLLFFIVGCFNEGNEVELNINRNNEQIVVNEEIDNNNGIGFQNKIINPCNSLSEEDCFKTLKGCIKANSMEEIIKKIEGIHFWEGGELDEYNVSEEKPIIKSNFPNGEILSYTKYLGGGDFSTYNYIKLKNKYCEINTENAKIIYSPITSKEDAFKYYYGLTTKGATLVNYIMEVEDYEKQEIVSNSYFCKDDIAKIKNKITTIKETSNGYEINFVGHDYYGENYFFENLVKIGFNGSIEVIKQNKLLECGPGVVF